MKKHITLSLALLASGVAQAHVHPHSLQTAIDAIEKTVHRGPTNSQLVAAMTAIQVALNDLQDTLGSLKSLKNNLTAISTAIDAGAKDLDDEIKALENVVGKEETAAPAAPVVAPVEAPVVDAVPAVVPTTLPTVHVDADADEEDEHEHDTVQ
jgi:peptidoglycan hydrolase CwlO-like protein